jgi:hypothetical protein
LTVQQGTQQSTKRGRASTARRWKGGGFERIVGNIVFEVMIFVEPTIVEVNSTRPRNEA